MADETAGELLAGIEIPDPLPFRSIPTPPEVTRVAGCDCGGVTFHRAADWNGPGCSIWALPHEQQLAAVDEAEARIRAFGAALTDRLQAALARGLA